MIQVTCKSRYHCMGISIFFSLSYQGNIQFLYKPPNSNYCNSFIALIHHGIQWSLDKDSYQNTPENTKPCPVCQVCMFGKGRPLHLLLKQKCLSYMALPSTTDIKWNKPLLDSLPSRFSRWMQVTKQALSQQSCTPLESSRCSRDLRRKGVS